MKFFVKDFGSGAHLYMFDVPSGHLGVDPSRCAIKPRIESDALGRLIGGSEFAVGVQDKHEPLLYTIHNNDSDSFGMLSEDYCPTTSLQMFYPIIRCCTYRDDDDDVAGGCCDEYPEYEHILDLQLFARNINCDFLVLCVSLNLKSVLLHFSCVVTAISGSIHQL